MSLILEALKKSEQQRRLGEAPTLGSPMLTTRRKRSFLPLFGALIVLALGAGWWLSRTPDNGADTPLAAGPTDAAPAPAHAPAARTPASAAPIHNDRAAAVANARNVDAPVAPPDRPRSTNPAARLQTEAPPALAQRHPVTPTAVTPGVKPVATAPAAAPAPKPAATPPPAATAPTSTPGTAMAPKPATAPAIVDAPVVPTPAPTPAPAAPPKPQQPALPSVWELPYATRKDLPELSLTMHVYSGDPHDRFVVIKGERHVEGDTVGDGVVLREIRPDGMVLEFKGRRFVYPRDGR